MFAPVRNVHQRELPAPVSRLAPLIDGLASAQDRLWPADRWPRMRFDRPLGVGAQGGHGPIGYLVESYLPGRLVQFRFTEPTGFDGVHRFELEAIGSERSMLRHTIAMRVARSSYLKWLLVIRPLHNALIEDALDRASSFAECPPKQRPWSLWVRLLRNTARKKPRSN